jgi:small-conductance mechanosensitive channel
MTITGAIQNWDQAVLTSASNVLSSIGNFLPSLIGAIVILAVGFIAANLVGALLTRVLVGLRFNDLADRLEVNRFIRNTGVRLTAAEVVGQLGYWFVLITAFLAAADTLGLRQVSALLGNVLLYIPNVIVAIVILLAGALIGDLVANVVRGTVRTARVTTAETLARVTRWAIMVFAVLLALDQLGIASRFIETLFTGFVAALAIAMGLSFGLGGQRWAASALETLTRTGSEVAEAARETRAQARPARRGGRR